MKGQHGVEISEKEIVVCSEVQEEGICVSDQKSFPYKTRDSNTEKLATKQEDDFIGIWIILSSYR